MTVDVDIIVVIILVRGCFLIVVVDCGYFMLLVG